MLRALHAPRFFRQQASRTAARPGPANPSARHVRRPLSARCHTSCACKPARRALVLGLVTCDARRQHLPWLLLLVALSPP